MAFHRYKFQSETSESSFLPKSRSVSLDVFLPNYEKIHVDFVSNDKDTVRDFLVYIWEKASQCKALLTPFPPNEVDLLIDRTEQLMKSTKLFKDYHVQDNDAIYVVKKVADSVKNAVEYDEFIRSSYPQLNTTTGSTIDFPARNGKIVIRFGASRKRQSQIRLFTGSLIDHRVLPTTKSGDMVHNLAGNVREAKKRGFVSWTDKEYSHRLYLLQLDANRSNSSSNNNSTGFSFNDFSRIEHLRYSASGILNRGYEGGDDRSWQRYTNQQPIPCELFEDSVFEFRDYAGRLDAAVAAVSARMDLPPISSTVASDQQSATNPDADAEGTSTRGVIAECRDLSRCGGTENGNTVADDDDGDDDGEEISVVTALPLVPLEPDTYYTVLLANGVPLTPNGGCSSDLSAFTASCTTEDLLIVFKTAGML